MATIRAKIEHGSIRSSGFIETISKFNGQDVIISIEKAPLKRSLAQNRYYQKVVVTAFFKLWRDVVVYKCPKTGEDVKGMTPEMAHEMLRMNFLSMDVVSPKTGKVIKTSRSTTSLSTTEMMDYINACRNYYHSETGEYIDPPTFL